MKNDKAFRNFALFVPLLLILPWLPTFILGCVALAYVLTRCWADARRDPALLAFVGFSLAVLLAYDLGGSNLRSATVPYTGWLPTGPYGWSIWFAVAGLMSIPRARSGVVVMCLVHVAIGSYDWATEGARWSLNPYTSISVWRPVWTVVIPLAWAVIVLVFRPRAAGSGEREIAV